MKLNHLNLTVTDAIAARDFLASYFGLRAMEGGSQAFVFMQDDHGMVLTLIRTRGEVTYPPSFHIGFIQESEEQVNEINRRMREDGHNVDPPARLHGSWTFYHQAPGGFTVEVLA